jgi:SAM-dependent methyltransferase
MTTPEWDDRRMAFGAWAEQYDRWRPDYPADAVSWLVDAPDGHALRVVDLGAGTGRLGLALARLGHDVTSVEPDDGMRAVAERVLPGRTVAGVAESMPLETASVDAVLAGQAYHWFDAARALPEIARPPAGRPPGHRLEHPRRAGRLGG